MAKLFWLILLLSPSVGAQIFSLPFNDTDNKTPWQKALSGMRELKPEEDKDFEEKFKGQSSDAEKMLELQRMECQEKNPVGAARQRCFRDVVARNKEYIEASYQAKTRILILLHQRQLKQLEEDKTKALQDLDKQF